MLLRIISEDKSLNALSLDGCPLIKFNKGSVTMTVTNATAGRIIKELDKNKGFRYEFLVGGL